MASSSGNDDDLTIPRAAINKMIKETLPNVRVANDARELVVNCCTEFIHLVSSEANEICNKSEKKTISPEHVINGQFTFPFQLLCTDCRGFSCVLKGTFIFQSGSHKHTETKVRIQGTINCSIMNNPTNPLHALEVYKRRTFSQRLIAPKCKTERYSLVYQLL